MSCVARIDTASMSKCFCRCARARARLWSHGHVRIGRPPTTTVRGQNGKVSCLGHDKQEYVVSISRSRFVEIVELWLFSHQAEKHAPSNEQNYTLLQ